MKTSLIGLDNLIEDLFGLNAKAFRSIWISFRRPKTYAIAAATSNWSDAFTPTVRVWFGLVALYSALRFFYGGADGAMTQMYVEMFEAAIAENPDTPFATVDLRAFSQSILKWTLVFFPFVMLPFYAVIAFFFRVWPDKPGFVVRFRYIMLTVLPGTALTALITLSFVFLEAAQLNIILFANLVGLVILDGVTAYRGTLHSVAPKDRLGLSFVLLILLNVAFVIGSIVAFIPAVAAAAAELAPKP